MGAATKQRSCLIQQQLLLKHRAGKNPLGIFLVLVMGRKSLASKDLEIKSIKTSKIGTLLALEYIA